MANNLTRNGKTILPGWYVDTRQWEPFVPEGWEQWVWPSHLDANGVPYKYGKVFVCPKGVKCYGEPRMDEHIASSYGRRRCCEAHAESSDDDDNSSRSDMDISDEQHAPGEEAIPEEPPQEVQQGVPSQVVDSSTDNSDHQIIADSAENSAITSSGQQVENPEDPIEEASSPEPEAVPDANVDAEVEVDLKPEADPDAGADAVNSDDSHGNSQPDDVEIVDLTGSTDDDDDDDAIQMNQDPPMGSHGGGDQIRDPSAKEIEKSPKEEPREDPRSTHISASALDPGPSGSNPRPKRKRIIEERELDAAGLAKVAKSSDDELSGFFKETEKKLMTSLEKVSSYIHSLEKAKEKHAAEKARLEQEVRDGRQATAAAQQATAAAQLEAQQARQAQDTLKTRLTATQVQSVGYFLQAQQAAQDLESQRQALNSAVEQAVDRALQEVKDVWKIVFEK